MGAEVFRFSPAKGFALEARAYFLLLRQKKVAKEKATPGYAVGYADSPALLETGGGCGTRASPSDSPRPFSAAFSVARRFTRGPKNGIAQPWPQQIDCCGQPEKKPKNENRCLSPDAFPGPLRGAEQRRSAGGSRLALSEPQASLASRPAFRVAQGTGAAGTDPGVAFSLATFFWRQQKKVRPPARRNPKPNQTPKPEVTTKC